VNPEVVVGGEHGDPQRHESATTDQEGTRSTGRDHTKELDSSTSDPSMAVSRLEYRKTGFRTTEVSRAPRFAECPTFGYTYFDMFVAIDVRPVSRLFKALGDETRLRIVALLSHDELCVCHLVDALRLSQPHVSRHLAILRAAGVVESRREGSWIYYRLARQADRDRERQLEALVRTFDKQTVVRRDLERLVKLRGPEACR